MAEIDEIFLPKTVSAKEENRASIGSTMIMPERRVIICNWRYWLPCKEEAFGMSGPQASKVMKSKFKYHSSRFINNHGAGIQIMLRVKNRIGFWLAVFTAVLTIISFSLALLGTLSYTYPYPYTPSYIPADYAWLIPAFLLMPVFLALVAFIHHNASDEKKMFSRIALSFAMISAAMLMFDFFIQWTVVLPSTLAGEVGGLSLFTQYNPHGLFVSIESLAYLLMSTSFLALAPLFNEGRLQRSIRLLFVASFVLAVGSFVGLTLAGHDIVQFEVLVISIDWITLIVSGIFLSVLFRRAAKTPPIAS
jgi:hypothetical protein